MTKLGKVTIINRHLKTPGLHSYDCTRRGVLGNPYPMQTRGYHERNRVCDAYEIWFKAQMETDTLAARMVRTMVDKVLDGIDIELVCVCVLPNAKVRCHTETIKRFVDTQALKERNREIKAEDLF